MEVKHTYKTGPLTNLHLLCTSLPCSPSEGPVTSTHLGLEFGALCGHGYILRLRLSASPASVKTARKCAPGPRAGSVMVSRSDPSIYPDKNHLWAPLPALNVEVTLLSHPKFRSDTALAVPMATRPGRSHMTLNSKRRAPHRRPLQTSKFTF